jgi:hypothetical protein
MKKSSRNRFYTSIIHKNGIRDIKPEERFRTENYPAAITEPKW